jgi:hypothetical protein
MTITDHDQRRMHGPGSGAAAGLPANGAGPRVEGGGGGGHAASTWCPRGPALTTEHAWGFLLPQALLGGPSPSFADGLALYGACSSQCGRAAPGHVQE